MIDAAVRIWGPKPADRAGGISTALDADWRQTMRR